MAFNDLQGGKKWADEFKASYSPEEITSLSLPTEAISANPHQKLAIDITVEYLNPLGLPENGGLRTSTFINECLATYPAMRSQVLLLKWILATWGMNKTFTGNVSLKF